MAELETLVVPGGKSVVWNKL